MSVTLHTLTDHTLTATHHAMENSAFLGDASGILYGLEVTATDNTITIGNGYGLICGRLFEIQSEAIAVVLPSSQRTGQIIITLDLSLDAPLTVSYDLTGATLTQTEDAVYTNGIYQMQLCTFTATSGGVSDPVVTAKKLEGVGLVTENGTFIRTGRSVSENLALLDAAFSSNSYGTGITQEFTPVCAGFITNSKKNLEFTINPNRPLIGVSAAAVYGCYLTIRQNGQYLWGNGTNRAGVDPSELTCYLTRGGIRVKWAHGSVINSKAINNDACVIDCQIRFRFT